jgi:hypothetical protein
MPAAWVAVNRPYSTVEAPSINAAASSTSIVDGSGFVLKKKEYNLIPLVSKGFLNAQVKRPLKTVATPRGTVLVAASGWMRGDAIMRTNT